MALNNRYEPSHPAGQSCLYGLDFSNIIPLGITLTSVTVEVEYNTVPPTSQADFTEGAPYTDGRRAYVQLSGGQAGKDYRITFSAEDTLSNVWPRSCLLLVAATS